MRLAKNLDNWQGLAESKESWPEHFKQLRAGAFDGLQLNALAFTIWHNRFLQGSVRTLWATCTLPAKIRQGAFDSRCGNHASRLMDHILWWQSAFFFSEHFCGMRVFANLLRPQHGFKRQVRSTGKSNAARASVSISRILAAKRAAS